MSSESESAFAPAVIILAAGSSRRMGQPKLLLPWRQTSVLGHLLETWSALKARQIAVACARGAQAIDDELDRLTFPKENRIYNPAPDRGMFSSIQCAADWGGWNPELTHWIITLGDHPQLKQETLQALLDFSATQGDRIWQP